MVDIEDNFLSLMDNQGEMLENIKCPDNDLGKEIREKFKADDQLMVTVLRAMDEEAAIAIKMASGK